MSLVLLGCRVMGPRALSGPARRRAERALLAYREGVSRRILACGGKEWQGVREADALSAFLVDAGVPERHLEREVWSHFTRENAGYAARLLLPRGHYRVGVVTCDFHMERALYCFRAAGFEAHPLAAPSPEPPVARGLLRAAHERLSFALDRALLRSGNRP